MTKRRGGEGISQGKPSVANYRFLVSDHEHKEWPMERCTTRTTRFMYLTVEVTPVSKPSFGEFLYSVTGFVAVLLGCKSVDADEFMIALEIVCPVMF